ncbi:PREDICTED: uncharacterized protein LOC108569777 [Nicrophorus vespilloides]|uniref:Uncharacterized protein LOC108569777 n=1 Tax=Nicrophorus vespilloides TaxID=110193 RepID=A0ABM1NJF0_NICVS|nr:PREDICTED: uncharacterized protein LOC108569777 [Nicrophorus vespilloides]
MAIVVRLSVIKFLELLLAVACLGLMYKNGLTGDLPTDFVSIGAYVGFIIILVGGFSGHLLSSPITRRIDVFYCLVGCAMFIASGALLIKAYENRWKSESRDYGLATGALAIVNGVVFMIDSLLTWRGDY